MASTKKTAADRGEASRDRILAVAAEDFLSGGDANVRMERVAHRAKVNKSLVYRWFGDRDTLIRAAVERLFEQRRETLRRVPDDLGEALVHWSNQNLRDKAFVRLILLEALEDDGAAPVHEQARRQYYAQQVATLRGAEDAPRLPRSSDPEMMFLALLAMTFLPSALPTVVRLVTGLSPDSPTFKRRWHRTLRTIARQTT